MIQTPLNLNLLTEEIEEVRETLLHTGLSKGVDHPSTIHISKQLDELIVQYQTILFEQRYR